VATRRAATRGCTESCDVAACHGALTEFDDDFDTTSRQTNVQNVLDLIEADLFARGIIDTAGYIDIPITATTPDDTLHLRNDLAAAFINWQMLSEDRSLGIHSPYYVLNILQNTLDTLNALP
jgi:hypothetical protein